MGDIIRRRVVGFVKTKKKPKTPEEIAREQQREAREAGRADSVVDISKAELDSLREHVVVRPAGARPLTPQKKPVPWTAIVGGAGAGLGLLIGVWLIFDLFHLSNPFSGPTPTPRSERRHVESVASGQTSSDRAMAVRDSGGGSSAAYPGAAGTQDGGTVQLGGREAPTDASFMATFSTQRNNKNQAAIAAQEAASENIPAAGAIKPQAPQSGLQKNGQCVISGNGAAVAAAGLNALDNCLKQSEGKAQADGKAKVTVITR